MPYPRRWLVIGGLLTCVAFMLLTLVTGSRAWLLVGGIVLGLLSFVIAANGPPSGSGK